MGFDIYDLFLVGSVLIASFSQVLLKKGAQRTYTSILREYLNPYVISGYVLMVLSTVLTILAYTRVDYKNGPVIESLGIVFVMILSFFFFREKISSRKVVGVLMIFAGVMVFYL